MSYLRPILPRFYIDNINWATAKGGVVSIVNEGEALSGATQNINDIFNLKPSTTTEWSTDTDTTNVDIGVGFTGVDHAVDFMIILNHNLNTAGAEITAKYNNSASQINSMVSVLNAAEGTQDYAAPAADGDTIFTFNQLTSEADFNIIIKPSVTNFTADVKIGCILFGKLHTLPFGPTMGRSHQAQFPVKITESEGGVRFSNLPWTGVRQNSYAPFRGATTYQYGGRLIHELTFTHLADTALIRSDLSAITESADFESDVLQKTLNSHLPFVFVLDSASQVKGDYLFGRLFDYASREIACQAFEISCRIEEEF